jgi:hypothetical protein
MLGEFGPRFAAGYGRATGHAFDPATTSRSIGGFVAEISLLGRIGLMVANGLRLVGELELGSVVQGLDARADTRPAGGIGGTLWGIALGVGYDW